MRATVESNELESESMKQAMSEVDPEVARMILDETARQADTLELIASENFVSEAILEG